MTNDYVVIAQIAYDLQDASEELPAIMELIEPNKEIDEDEFNIRIAHLYRIYFNVRLTYNNMHANTQKAL